MQETLLLAALVYSIPVDKPLDYNLRVRFEGLIPILGGNEGVADVRLGVRVTGLAPIDGRMRTTSELTKAQLIFNDATLPLSLENIQDYFPKTTIEHNPLGKILKTDAPDTQLPVRLPGLDIKRFPDITFMPIEFPERQISVDAEWSFIKMFAGSDVTYKCRLKSLDEKSATVSLEVEQTYTVLEDSAMQVVTNRADAENEVTTKLVASGTVVFDRTLGVVETFKMNGKAASKVTPLAKGEAKTRDLAILVDFGRVKPIEPK